MYCRKNGTYFKPNKYLSALIIGTAYFKVYIICRLYIPTSLSSNISVKSEKIIKENGLKSITEIHTERTTILFAKFG